MTRIDMLSGMYIFNSIVPIFLLIIVGKVLVESKFFSSDFFKGLNRFVFWLALPAMLVERIGSGSFELQESTGVFFVIACGIITTGILGWLIAGLMKLPRIQRGSFIQGGLRGNNAFVGLPIILYTLSDVDPQAESIALLVFGPTVILYNILAVTALAIYGSKKARVVSLLGESLLKMLRNPLIIACVIGMIFQLTDLTLPKFMSRTLGVLGEAALSLALISIGAGISFSQLEGAALPSFMSAVIKVVVSPAIGFLLIPFVNVSQSGALIALITLACPTAVASYVMADQMGNDAILAGRIVIMSTLFSAITLPIVIALGGLL